MYVWAVLCVLQRDVNATSGTNMAAGLDAAYAQLENCETCTSAGPGVVENRVILITDAQPNEGMLAEEDFLAQVQSNADNNIFTTIIGVGLGMLSI